MKTAWFFVAAAGSLLALGFVHEARCWGGMGGDLCETIVLTER